MVDELDPLQLSTEAQKLIVDLVYGCALTKTSGGAPGILNLPSCGPIPRPMAQVKDSVIEELLRYNLLHLLRDGFPTPCNLTPTGEDYFRRHLESGNFPNSSTFNGAV